MGIVDRNVFVGSPILTKRNDTTPWDDTLEIETAPGSGVFQPLDLTGVSVTASCKDAGEPMPAHPDWGATVFAAHAVTVVSPPTAGKVRLTPTTGEMANAYSGTWKLEWSLTIAGVKQTIPAGAAYRRVIVGEDLG